MKLRYCVCLVLILLGGVLVVSPVNAQIDDITPYVSVRQEYSDNILLNSTDEKEDFITTGTAGVTFSRRDQRMQASLDGNVSRLMYQDNDDLNATDGQVRGAWNYQVTERFGAGLAASFLRDSRGDQYLDTTGVVLAQVRERDSTRLSGTMDYRFSELSAGEFTLAYGTTTVDELFNEEEDESVKVDLAFSRNLSRTFKNTTGLINVSYMRYTSDQETMISDPLVPTSVFQQFDADMFQVTAGFSRELTELIRMYVMAGVSYTESTETERVVTSGLIDSETTRPELKDDSLDGVLSAGVIYSGLYYDFRVSVSQDVQGGAGTNGTVERTAVNLGGSRRLTEDLSLTLNVSGYLNRREWETLSDLDQVTINVQPGFRYRITDTLDLSGAYRYTHVEERQTGVTRERNLVYLEIRKEFDL
jgi:hypothetical protein